MSPMSVGTSQSVQGGKIGPSKLWILLVGANHYQDASLPSLQYSALDCQGLGEALASATLAFPQKQIAIHCDLAEMPPTLAAVRNSLSQIISAAKPNDTVLFYFSGHGLLEPNSQQAILCLQDTRKDSPFETGLSLQELLNLLGNCAARQQLIWLDACHSGSLMLRGQPLERQEAGENIGSEPDGSRGTIEAETNLAASLLNPSVQLVEALQKQAAQSRGFYALLSCDRSQRSWEFPELGHGVFTYYLMRGIRGEAADAKGAIDADGLYKYVYHQTLQYIDKTNQQWRLINQQKRARGETQLHPEYPLQTPKRIVEGIGELVLGLKPEAVGAKRRRIALVVEGLSCSENSLACSKILRQVGNFELEYWPQRGKALSEVRPAIQTCLRSSASARKSQLEAETALLYLRGRIEETPEGEAWLVFADDARISRSWLRQELRRGRIFQQIIILDCPGATSLSEWVEDLQLELECGQCLIAAASPMREPERFAEILLETLQAGDRQVGLPAAGWISRLQMSLAGTGIPLHLWLSGTKGVIEILPGLLGLEDSKTAGGLDIKLCPYMGLQAFGEEEARFFYGRETLTLQLTSSLARSAFLAVVGASGSGKSSAVHAGLIPQLRQGVQLPGSDRWWIGSFRPGAHPLRALAGRLADAGTEEERALSMAQLEGLLYEGVEGFVCWLRSRFEPMVVLIIDQFEELFTLATAAERNGFLEILLGALERAGDRFKLVAVLRADFISSCLEVPALSQALQRESLFVPPYLTADDYRRAIVKPAEKVGLKVEPGLVEVLLQELSHTTGDLPVLEFVLEQLWERRRVGELTLEVYQQEIGGLKGALERKAQGVYESLDADCQRCAKWIFLALTQLGEGKEDTRRRALKSELVVKKYPTELVERTLQALTDAKLVVMNSESNSELAGTSRGSDEMPLEPDELLQKMQGEVTVEVAHEVLIRHWSTLQWWLEENRDRLRVQRQLAHAALLWKQSARQPDFLLQGVRLAQAEEIYIKYTDELSADIQQFVEACLQERQRQQRQEKRRLRQAQTAVGAISLLIAGALGLGGLAFQQSQKFQLGEIETLNSLAVKHLSSHEQLDALLASVKAARQLEHLTAFGKNFSPVPAATQSETIKTLKQILFEIQEYNRLEAHSKGVFSAVFSPDGQAIASASADATVNLWRRNGKLIKTLKGHSAGVWGVSFSPDGQTVASASDDTTIRLWKSSDGQLIRILTGHNEGVNSAKFSPDGKLIASASKDKTIKLWNSSSGEVLKTLAGHDGMVINANFSPDGKLIVSASMDGSIKIWNRSDGQLLGTIRAHNNGAYDVSFSPDGTLIASAGADGTVKLWKSSDRSLVKVLKGHNAEVNSVNFSPDGQIVISTSRDNTVKLWKTSNGIDLHTIRGHGAAVQSANFSPNGETIVSASRDGTVKLWKIGHLNQPSTIEINSAVSGVNFSPNGQLIASASDDNSVKLWNTSNGSVVATLEGHIATVNKVSFSPDSQLIASASNDKSVKLWNSRDRSPARTLKHTDEVTNASFSPDGKFLASASRDKTVKLWRTNDGSLAKTFQGHTAEVESVSFSPDGQLLASASRDKTVKLWRTSDGTLLKTFQKHAGQVYDVKFSPDGQTIASAGADETVILWRRDGTWLQTLRGHKSYVWEVSFSPNGQMIASASEDGTVKLWRTGDGQLLLTLNGHRGPIYGVSFSPLGQLIASASADQTVKLWRVNGAELQLSDLDSLLARTCDWLKDYLNTHPAFDSDERQLCSGLAVYPSP